MINHASNGTPTACPGARHATSCSTGERPEIGRNFSSATSLCVVKAGFAARAINPLFRDRLMLTVLLAGEDPQFLLPILQLAIPRRRVSIHHLHNPTAKRESLSAVSAVQVQVYRYSCVGCG